MKALSSIVFVLVAFSGIQKVTSQLKDASAPIMDKFDKAYATCKAEMGFKETNIQAYIQSQKPIGSGDGCGFACLATQLGFLENDKVDESKILLEIQKLEPKGAMLARITKDIHECANESSKETDKCKIAITFAKCQMAKFKEIMQSGKY